MPLNAPATETLALLTLLMTATLIYVVPMVIAVLFTRRQLMHGVVLSGVK